MSDQIPEILAKLATREQRTRHDEYVMAAITGLTQKLSPSDWGVSESSAVALRGLVSTARAIADEAMRTTRRRNFVGDERACPNCERQENILTSGEVEALRPVVRRLFHEPSIHDMDDLLSALDAVAKTLRGWEARDALEMKAHAETMNEILDGR